MNGKGSRGPEQAPTAVRGAASLGTAPALLGDLLAGARTVTARAARAAPIDRETWRRVVGDRIASRTEVARLDQRLLEVIVASPVWAQELSLLSREVVTRLRELGFGVERVRFRVGTVTLLETPARHRRAVAPATLPAELEDDLEDVDDLELREVIAEAARYSLGLAAVTPSASRAESGPRSAAPESARSVPSAPGSPGAPPRRA